MAENTHISWSNGTFNPWKGCVKVSPACQNCYAERDSKRNPDTLGLWGSEKAGGTRVVLAEASWNEPVKWNKKAEAGGYRWRVFCASLADVFEDWKGPMLTHKGEELFQCCQCQTRWSADMKDYDPTKRDPRVVCPKCHDSGENYMTMNEVRRRLFDLIDATPNLDWLLLTKRPENIGRMMPPPKFDHAGWNGTLAGYWWQKEQPRPNVWLGTTVENQHYADLRIPELLKNPAVVRFLSAEPLVGPVDLVQRFGDGGSRNFLTGQFDNISAKGVDGNPNFTVGTEDGRLPRIHWVITGGESGPSARPANSDWYRSLRDQCVAAGVPFHFKQWGEWVDAGVPAFGKEPSRRIALARADMTEIDPKSPDAKDEDADVTTYSYVGKKAAGRLLDGREWLEVPGVRT